MSIVLNSIDELETQNSTIWDYIDFVTKQGNTTMLELQFLREHLRENIKYSQQLETQSAIRDKNIKSRRL